jgi:hypothetical protein
MGPKGKSKKNAYETRALIKVKEKNLDSGFKNLTVIKNSRLRNLNRYISNGSITKPFTGRER